RCRSWLYGDRLHCLHLRRRPAHPPLRSGLAPPLRPPLTLAGRDGRLRTPLSGGGGSRTGDGLPRLGVDVPPHPAPPPDTARPPRPARVSSPRSLRAGAALCARAARGRAPPPRREWIAAAIVGAALLLVGNGGVAWAETRLDSGFAALIVAIIPLYVALFD